MFPDKFLEVLKHEGVVSLVSWGSGIEPHITNTWNSYLQTKSDGSLLIPAAGMTHLEADLAQNTKVIVTLGSRDVKGYNGYQGTGFKFYAEADLKDSGLDFDAMKEKYPFIRKVLILHPQEMKQLL